MKTNKMCCVRLPEDTHRYAKLEAYRCGMSLQDWIITLIEFFRIKQENESKSKEKPE